MGEVVEEGLEKRDGSATAVQWERFLPRTALRVLLVEADDSTSQIIAALLRKCSYKVSAVPDGFKAWQILKGKHHNIDLVLTEVELPSISGFALLTLVMEHDVCKSIPVIMMSSHDSFSMVLKCMLKGAAELLIKPVRKNELRNLWQHVWRRHTLAGGHIPSNLTATQQKVEACTDNNTTINHSSDYVICSSTDKDSREKGSDAPHLSQPKCKNAFNLSNSQVEKQEESAKLPQESVIQLRETEESPSEIGIDVAQPLNALRLGVDHDCAEAMTRHESLGPECAGNGNITSEGSGNRREVDEPLSAPIDFIGTFDNHPMCSHVNSGVIYGGSNKFESIPRLELSLRRLSPKDDKTDERHTLSHFNASTISWCNSTKTLHSFFPTLPGTCTESEEGTDKIRQLLSSHYYENTVGISQKCATLGKIEENTTALIDDLSGKAEIAFPRPIPEADFWSPKPACQEEKHPSFQANTRSNNLYQRPDETFDDQSVSEENSSEELRHDVSSATAQSCSSSLCNGIATQLSCNLNGSISKGNAEDEQANPPEKSNDGVRRAGSLGSSEREAALTKFRLKRKDRCYEKKVRYQSRKRLAEQRPRVKGQFVRQVQTSTAGADG